MFINSIYNIKTITVKETFKKNLTIPKLCPNRYGIWKIWKSAIGANPKVKRLKLQADNDGLFSFSCSFL